MIYSFIAELKILIDRIIVKELSIRTKPTVHSIIIQ